MKILQVSNLRASGIVMAEFSKNYMLISVVVYFLRLQMNIRISLCVEE